VGRGVEHHFLKNDATKYSDAYLLQISCVRSKTMSTVLLIDAENVNKADYYEDIVKFVTTRVSSNIVERRFYADMNMDTTTPWKQQLEKHATLTAVHVKNRSGKNSADIKLTVDCMDIVQKQDVRCVVIASGDSDYSSLVDNLKEKHVYVVGFGNRQNTAPILQECCNEYHFLEDVCIRNKEHDIVERYLHCISSQTLRKKQAEKVELKNKMHELQQTLQKKQAEKVELEKELNELNRIIGIYSVEN